MADQDDPSGYSQEQQDRYMEQLRKRKSEFQERWKYGQTLDVKLDEFQRIQILGTGAFGVVYLAKKKDTGKFYAMKILEKLKVIRQKQLEHTLYEKKILCAVRFPFVINMEYFCKDNVYVYFILPYVVGGEMFKNLRDIGKFEEGTSRFYGGQVLLALEYLHTCDLIYRDLKPENILIDKTGYIKIVDLGFCKVLRGRTWTLCGTPEYLAPEVILSKGYGISADWWSFGILLYEMSAGHPPFYASEPMKIYERIVAGKYRTPSHFSSDLKDLVKNTLQVDITRRYGVLKDGTMDFKNHRWFKNFDWDGIVNCRVASPFIPKYSSPGDTSNFEYYDNEKLMNSDHCMFAEEFEDF